MLQYNFFFNFVLDSTKPLIYISGIIHLFIIRVHSFSILIPWHTCGGQKITCESQFSLYMDVLGIKHRFLPCRQPLYSLPLLVGPYLFPCYFHQKRRTFFVLSCCEFFPHGIFTFLLQTGSHHAMTCLTISHNNIQHTAVLVQGSANDIIK